MKKSLLTMLALGALVFAGCSSEEPAKEVSDGATVFAVNLPYEISSRAYDNGYTATKLDYVIYENTGTTGLGVKKATGEATFADNSLKTEVTVNLIKNRRYNIVFWAQAPGAEAYTLNADDATLSVDYDKLSMNDANVDAFFGWVKDFTVTGNVKKDVTLYRPLAQINVGTDDIAEAEAVGYTHALTEVAVSNVYDKLELYTGKALMQSGTETKTVTYAAKGVVDEAGAKFPVEHSDATQSYTYLVAAYVLNGASEDVDFPDDCNHAQAELSEVTLKFMQADKSEINTLTVNSVPLQRNYRTNIYGSLLTNTVMYTVEKVPGFWDEYNIENGKLVTGK